MRLHSAWSAGSQSTTESCTPPFAVDPNQANTRVKNHSLKPKPYRSFAAAKSSEVGLRITPTWCRQPEQLTIACLRNKIEQARFCAAV